MKYHFENPSKALEKAKLNVPSLNQPKMNPLSKLRSHRHPSWLEFSPRYIVDELQRAAKHLTTKQTIPTDNTKNEVTI